MIILESESIKEIFQSYDGPWSKVDRAFGSVMGAFVGDALGAYLEFDYNIYDEKVMKALEMPGGGTMRTGPG